MLFVLSRLLGRLEPLLGWLTPIVVISFVFATSWPLMALAEPADSELVRPANYWWFFVVTAATVGYGDFFPKTGLGHVVGAYVIIGGIVALTTVFTRLVSTLSEAKGRIVQGTITVRATGHTVLLGYLPGRTERLVTDLLADGCPRLVLCAWSDTPTHPMPDRTVDFVRGDLTDEATLRRAGVHRAAVVLVDARDDNEALALATIVDHLNPNAHTVVTLRDLDRTTLLHYVDPKIRCVQWHSPRMITEEMTSPGITEVYTDLMTHGGADTYSVTIPDSIGPLTMEQCQITLGRHHGITVLAIRTADGLTVNPGWATELEAGTVLYYIGPRRLTSDELRRAF
ncbi:NAD-binding protein [Nocardia sp. CDC159]|uniref:NAD-binding protein n=1 Tax=Nocardia pulmonis TaxID=2951408 RepID=A0A9X2IX25_9NOCA|nr:MULTISPECIES: NAD-binding protein [Nocardia]MCM6773395.1 NAD-binding protein [Nocardia pulmonis]MCM6786282.1 NAD-binding protein [Nocardia sp. CDC159]